jgi:hypothetical protein
MCAVTQPLLTRYSPGTQNYAIVMPGSDGSCSSAHCVPTIVASARILSFRHKIVYAESIVATSEYEQSWQDQYTNLRLALLQPAQNTAHREIVLY